MICILDAINREELVDHITDLGIFEDNFARLKLYFMRMFYISEPQEPLFFMSLFGSFLGDDIAEYLISRFEHLSYHGEKIIIDEKTFNEYENLALIFASDFRLVTELEPSIFPIIIAKGDDNQFYLNLFIL